jgi:hypothetical protein
LRGGKQLSGGQLFALTLTIAALFIQTYGDSSVLDIVIVLSARHTGVCLHAEDSKIDEVAAAVAFVSTLMPNENCRQQKKMKKKREKGYLLLCELLGTKRHAIVS